MTESEFKDVYGKILYQYLAFLQLVHCLTAEKMDQFKKMNLGLFLNKLSIIL